MYPAYCCFFFFFFFCRSFYLLTELAFSSPVFEKKRLKYLSQLSSYTSKATPVVLLYYLALLFRNLVYGNLYGPSFNLYASFLPLLFLVTYIFLKLGEFFYGQYSENVGTKLQHLNSSGFFILNFIPVATCFALSDNLIDLLLPLELMGVVFYFIFLEFSFHAHSKSHKPQNQPSVRLRGLVYYF